MRIIAKSTLIAYYTKNPQAKTALEEWYNKTREAELKTFADIKKLSTPSLLWATSIMFSTLKATTTDWWWSYSLPHNVFTSGL